MQHQYTQIAAVLLSAALLTGCAKPSPAEPQTTETEQVTESTAVPETTEPAAPALRFTMEQDGVSFLLDGVLFQTIPMEHVPDADEISICDYDSDGFADVFLPDWPNSFRGHYYRYDDASGQLILWDALNFEEGGTGWIMEQQADGTLLLKSDSIYGSSNTTYRWEQGTLIPVALTEYYWVSAGTVEDSYTYAQDGEKVLYLRRILDSDTGKCIETIEHPLYFRITADAVHVMQGTEIMQEIAVGGFWDGYAELEAFYAQQEITPTVPLDGAHLREPEQYLGTEDYDFDGYADLYVPDSLYGTQNGTYYRFSPETGEFVLWDALNILGYPLYAEAEHSILSSYHNGQHEKWQWQNEQLIEIETET